MAGQITLDWYLTSEKPHPDKPGKARYEHVVCLVNRVGHGLQTLAWNCEHLVWDDEQMDDYECEVKDVTAWMALPDRFPPEP